MVRGSSVYALIKKLLRTAKNPAAEHYQPCPTICSDQRGAVMIEASFAISFFILFFLIGISIIHVLFQRHFTEHSIFRAARWAVTGKQLPSLNREESIQQQFENFASGYGIPVVKTNLRICRVTDTSCSTNANIGPGEMFYLGYSYTTNVLLLNTPITFDIGAYARNESF